MLSQLIRVLFYVSFFTIVRSRRTGSAEMYIKQHEENQAYIDALGDEPYEIVYPVQVRDRQRINIDTRNYYYTNATYHYEKTTFIIRATIHRRLRLDVSLNHALLVPEAQYQYRTEGRDASTRGKQLVNCYYKGAVNGLKEPSMVALATCFGLKGVIYIGNDTFTIHPLTGGQLDRRHPHILHRSRPATTQPYKCANSGAGDWSTQGHHRRHRHQRDVGRVTKYIELAVLFDQQASARFHHDFAKSLFHVLTAVNVMDAMFSADLNTRVSLVYAEVWTRANSSSSGTAPAINPSNAMESVLNVIDFASRHMQSVSRDVLLYVSAGRGFAHNEIGAAASGNLCSPKAVGLVDDPHAFEPHQLAGIASHVIGHIVGMRHDESGTELHSAENDCSCQHLSSCLMSDHVLVHNNLFPYRFSSCSVADYLDTMASGQGRCLLNKPMEPDLAQQLCGNGIVDHQAGETCDCGSVAECAAVDPCCDAVTCQLKAGAECAAGECCDAQCKLRPRTHVCRSSSGECDVPELCSGESGACPVDAHAMNGVECGHNGYCFLGQCNTADSQCRALWGQAANSSEVQCYEKFNRLGEDNGNCGRDEKGSLIPCAEEDVLCGLVQCQYGADEVVLEEFDGSYYKTEFYRSGRNYQCKVATSGRAVTGIDVGAVQTGTKCGANRICVGRKCVPLSSVTPEPDCPTNNLALLCSGHGICTNKNTCFCNRGWTGHDCSRRRPHGEPDPADLMMTHPSSDTRAFTSSQTPPPVHPTYRSSVPPAAQPPTIHSQERSIVEPILRLDTYTMLIILSGVAGGVFVFVLFLVLCYRRRSNTSLLLKKHCGPLSGSTVAAFEHGSDTSASTAMHNGNTQSVIKFGSMPSYRDEKRRKRYLHQIREVDEKTNSSKEGSELVATMNGSICSNGRQSDAGRHALHSACGLSPPERHGSTPPTQLPVEQNYRPNYTGSNPYLHHHHHQPSPGILRKGSAMDGYCTSRSDAGAILSPMIASRRPFSPQHHSQHGSMSKAPRTRARDGYESDTYVSCRSMFNGDRGGVRAYEFNEALMYGQSTTSATTNSEGGPYGVPSGSSYGVPQMTPTNTFTTPPRPHHQQQQHDANRYSSPRLRTPTFARQTPQQQEMFRLLDSIENVNEPITPRSPSSARRGLSLPPADGTPATVIPNRNAFTTDRYSPAHSISSSQPKDDKDCGSNLEQPPVLKLKNIEYLLRQLDSNSLSLSPTSSAEFSPIEADRYEVGSNTESSQGMPPQPNHMHLKSFQPIMTSSGNKQRSSASSSFGGGNNQPEFRSTTATPESPSPSQRLSAQEFRQQPLSTKAAPPPPPPKPTTPTRVVTGHDSLLTMMSFNSAAGGESPLDRNCVH